MSQGEFLVLAVIFLVAVIGVLVYGAREEEDEETDREFFVTPFDEEEDDE